MTNDPARSGQLEKRITALEEELRFIENNFRQIVSMHEDEKAMKPDALAGACEGWANRISRLLAKTH
jgi:hypothetical protein